MILMVYIHNYQHHLSLTFCASFKIILDMTACTGINLRLSMHTFKTWMLTVMVFILLEMLGMFFIVGEIWYNIPTCQTTITTTFYVNKYHQWECNFDYWSCSWKVLWNYFFCIMIRVESAIEEDWQEVMNTMMYSII